MILHNDDNSFCVLFGTQEGGKASETRMICVYMAIGNEIIQLWELYESNQKILNILDITHIQQSNFKLTSGSIAFTLKGSFFRISVFYAYEDV